MKFFSYELQQITKWGESILLLKIQTFISNASFQLQIDDSMYIK